MGKGRGPNKSSIKLNLSDPCHIKYRASTVVEGCQAGWLGHLSQYEYMHEYNAESPKQDSKKFNSYGRRNNLPIWVYNLSMSTVHSTKF